MDLTRSQTIEIGATGDRPASLLVRKAMRAFDGDLEGLKSESGAPIDLDSSIEEVIAKHGSTVIVVFAGEEPEPPMSPPPAAAAAAALPSPGPAAGGEVSTLDPLELSGHTEQVSSVQFSPHDKDLVASGSYDGTVKVWRSQGAQLLTTLSDHTEPVTSVAWSMHKEMVLASASGDETIIVWDVRSGQAVQKLQGRWSAPLPLTPFLRPCSRAHGITPCRCQDMGIGSSRCVGRRLIQTCC